MRKNRGQNTIEYVLFLTIATVLLIKFFFGFWDKSSKYWWQWDWTPSVFQTALTSIVNTPGDIISNQITNSTRLDIYGPWPSDGPGVQYLGYGTAYGWTDNQVGWTPGCDTSKDTCSTTEPNHPPLQVNQNCYPGMDYDCHEAWCWWGQTLQFDKHCRTAAILVDTCPGSNEFTAYQCQNTDDFPTCNDIIADIGCLAADVPGGCWNGVGYFSRTRTVKCTTILLP